MDAQHASARKHLLHQRLVRPSAGDPFGVAEIRRSWPAGPEWPALLAAAERRPTWRWQQLHDGEGGRRLAAVVRTVAAAP